MNSPLSYLVFLVITLILIEIICWTEKRIINREENPEIKTERLERVDLFRKNITQLAFACFLFHFLLSYLIPNNLLASTVCIILFSFFLYYKQKELNKSMKKYEKEEGE